MKTLKTSKIYFMALTLAILAATMFGCSEESSIFSPVSGSKQHGDNPPAGNITVTVEKEYGGYTFKVSNAGRDTINDFHVQFDTTVSISGWSLAWMMDPNTTNLNKGKIGEKCRPNDQPLLPGQQNRPLLWVELKFNGRKVIKTYNWQATKNGAVVERGSGTLPD